MWASFRRDSVLGFGAPGFRVYRSQDPRSENRAIPESLTAGASRYMRVLLKIVQLAVTGCAAVLSNAAQVWPSKPELSQSHHRLLC